VDYERSVGLAMGVYILKRLCLGVPTLFVASIIIFSLMHLAPGGPVSVILGSREVDPVLVAQLRQQLGLDLPVYQQYLRWLSRALHGDLGSSVVIQQGAPVSHLITQRLLVTLELAILALIVGLLMIPLGVLSALHQNTFLDHVARLFALLGLSIPNFFLGLLLILLFGVCLGKPWGVGGFIPPAEGIRGNLLRMFLPAITLGTSSSAVYMRMMRSTMLDVMREDYVRTARAMGIGSGRIIRQDMVRNALIPVITVIGNSLGGLLAGSIVTETVFRLPGVGQLTITAVFSRDYPVIMGILLTIVVIRVVVNLVVDLLYAYIDPRIRYG